MPGRTAAVRRVVMVCHVLAGWAVVGCSGANVQLKPGSLMQVMQITRVSRHSAGMAFRRQQGLTVPWLWGLVRATACSGMRLPPGYKGACFVVTPNVHGFTLCAQTMDRRL